MNYQKSTEECTVCVVCMNALSTHQLFKINQVVVKSLVAFMNECNV